MHIQDTLIQTHFTKYSRELYERLLNEGHDIGKFSQQGDMPQFGYVTLLSFHRKVVLIQKQTFSWIKTILENISR